LLHLNLECIYDGIASLCSQSIMTIEIVATEDENGSSTETHWVGLADVGQPYPLNTANLYFLNNDT